MIEIDEDVLKEYWIEIRRQPEKKSQTRIRCSGKYGGRGPN
jgi:hypothetical protein